MASQVLGYEYDIRESKFKFSNLGSIQQVRAVGKELLTQALQRRLQDIGMLSLSPNPDLVEFKQKGTRSEQRFENQFKEVYQNHMREIKEKRKNYVTDKKLIKFNINKNPEIYFNLEHKADSR